MANIASAKKRAKQAVKRHTGNTSLRSRAYTYLKTARYAIEACSKKNHSAEQLDTAKQAVKKAMTEIDRMVPKRIFHLNKASRLKSHLNANLKKVLG